MVNKKEIARKEYVIMIGEELKKCLDKQKESIREVSYGILNKVSYYNAGEVLAKKINENNII